MPTIAEQVIPFGSLWRNKESEMIYRVLGIIKLEKEESVEGEDNWLEGVYYQFKDNERSKYVRTIGRFLDRFERVE